MHTLEGHSDWVSSAALSHDSALVVIGIGRSHCKDLGCEDSHVYHMLEDHSRSVNPVGFSHESRLVTLALGDHTVKVWDTKMVTYIYTSRDIAPVCLFCQLLT